MVYKTELMFLYVKNEREKCMTVLSREGGTKCMLNIKLCRLYHYYNKNVSSN